MVVGEARDSRGGVALELFDAGEVLKHPSDGGRGDRVGACHLMVNAI